MNITLNNINSPSRILTFSDIPNIVKVSEDITGRNGVFSFVFNGNLKTSVSADSQYYVTFLDETVTNVMSPSKANNKRFYISTSPTSTAASFARAIRSCPSIMANFTVEHSGTEVELVARTMGKAWSDVPNYFSTNISSPYLTTTAYDGVAYSSLFGAKVQLDFIDNDNNYLTTLEKNFYGDECAFNISPILSTMSEYGKANEYKIKLSSIASDGEYSSLGTVSGYTTVGYAANQSDRYKFVNGADIMLNSNRNQVRYVYGTSIPYSVLWGNTATYLLAVSIKDSAFNTLYTYSSTIQTENFDSHIVDTSYTIPNQYHTLASYVDITIGNKTTRFKVIKPLKSAEYYQRILWRNEYGGIEFFDFTGQRSEYDSVDIETYEKNIFDYYTTSEYQSKKIYKNDYKKSVKLTSHLLESNGRWTFNSLMNSKSVWTVINNKTYYIIPKSIEVTEDQTYNNIYTATLTYEYSQIT